MFRVACLAPVVAGSKITPALTLLAPGATIVPSKVVLQLEIIWVGAGDRDVLHGDIRKTSVGDGDVLRRRRAAHRNVLEIESIRGHPDDADAEAGDGNTCCC